jgi:DNA-binding MarR family transcriptional regulator/GNAT superfamily N-acetyltransferase
MDDSLIADIRAFNRFYTRLIGALDAGHLQTPYTLTEARMIYEIATRGRVGHGELATALKLDQGYLTRLNYKLTDLGLIGTVRDKNDRRANSYALTREGEAAFEVLNEATNDLFDAMLQPLDAGQRRALVDAMRSIQTLLGDPPPRSPVVLRPRRIGDIGWMIHRQGVLYNQQFGWNIEFEALIAGIYSEYERASASPPKDLWVADQNGAIVGSIFVMPSDGIESSAQLRMLYVEPSARGQGVGAALVAQAVGFARDNGYARMRLWTHTIQESARRIYAAAGFTIVETMLENSFGKEMVGEIWEMVF